MLNRGVSRITDTSEIISKDGNSFAIRLNPKIYSLHSIYSAAYLFTDRAYIMLDGDAEKEIIVKLIPKKDTDPNLDKDFYNELVNFMNYSLNMKSNSDAIKLIIEKALFSANKALIDEAEEQEIQNLLKELEEDDDDEIKEIIKEIKDEQGK